MQQRQFNHKAALRRMAVFATLLTLAGHVFLGFEQSWAQVVFTLLAAYTVDTLLEVLDARLQGRPTRFASSWKAYGEFLLSSHLTGLSVALLLYTDRRIMPLVFATVVGIGFKWLFRIPTERGSRHFFNPSNVGITTSLLVFPSIGVAMPYQFTENVAGAGDWIVPGVIVVIGSFLNAKLTGRVPLIFGWLGGFAAQAVVRNLVFGTSVVAGLVPFTGMAFMLYTLYMITDPATTPDDPRRQVAFGAGVAAAYGLLMALHVVFGLFFALTIVCAVRGVSIWVLTWRQRVLQNRHKAVEAGEART